MPEYLAPGVYVEETSFRPRPLEGVSTSTAGFVGPARFGPVEYEAEPPLLTSFADFERIYGGLDSLDLGKGPETNFLAHAVRAFFEEGGRRCYVVRVADNAAAADGTLGYGGSAPYEVEVRARYPGEASNLRVTFTAVAGSNALTLRDPNNLSSQVLRGLRSGDTVFLEDPGDSSRNGFYDVGDDRTSLEPEDKGNAIGIGSLTVDPENEDSSATVQRVTVRVSAERPLSRPNQPGTEYEPAGDWDGLALHPERDGSLADFLDSDPSSRRVKLSVPFYMGAITDPDGNSVDAAGVHYAKALFGSPDSASDLEDGARSQRLVLEGGSDGGRPRPADFAGDVEESGDGKPVKTGLAAMKDLDDVSIVAAPGHSSTGYSDAQAQSIAMRLISHCEDKQYRIAVLDSRDGHSVGQVRQYRGKLDSAHAALYYPWVTILDPLTHRELNLPPSGFVAGIYARNDAEHGVQKAPANEVVRLALRFEVPIDKRQQEVLNPEGINAFRFFEGRGYRLWGARLASSDPLWKYVSTRRYFAYLERSIDEGTQWVVFESNSSDLWDSLRRTVRSFLFNEWKAGRLMGLTPEQAFFVRCDRSTMTQNDIDNGRLICEIGVAVLKPAEFVIFRIGQKLIEGGG